MKLFVALKHAAFAAKAFAAASLNFETLFAAGNENAIKDHVEAKVSEVRAENAELTTALTEATAENERLSTELATAAKAAAQVSILTSSLTAIGAKLPEPKANATPEEIVAANKAALEAHIKIRAQGVLAQTGHTALADVADQKVGLTMTRAAFNGLTHAAQSDFCKSGGKITD